MIADKDVPVILSAINGKAAILVTGDNNDFGKLRERFSRELRVEIVNPSEFVEGIVGRLAIRQQHQNKKM